MTNTTKSKWCKFKVDAPGVSFHIIKVTLLQLVITISLKATLCSSYHRRMKSETPCNIRTMKLLLPPPKKSSTLKNECYLSPFPPVGKLLATSMAIVCAGFLFLTECIGIQGIWNSKPTIRMSFAKYTLCQIVLKMPKKIEEIRC